MTAPESVSGPDVARHRPATWALLLDGRIVRIRPTREADLDDVERLHASMSEDNQRLRFLGWSRLAPRRIAHVLCTPANAGHCGLGAWLDGRLIGVGQFEREGVDSTAAEVAFAVADDAHHLGVATLLLEHLAARARDVGIRRFTAEVATTNVPMLHVFAAAGLTMTTVTRGSTVGVTATLEADEAYLAAVVERERTSQVASLRAVLAARSVVVVGRADQPAGVGAAVVRNLRRGGFAGRLAVVSPYRTQFADVGRVPDPAALDFPPDLVVVAVPPAELPDAVESCGRIGARAVVVLTANVAPDLAGRVLDTCRHHGMRLIGPNCLGVANPSLGLDATFGPGLPAAGQAGVAVQSGGIGIAVAEQMSRLGIGVSTFVSLGDKLDVSATDLLHYWYTDESTRLAILYLESFGNPRKFIRVARRLGARKPILAVDAGRSEASRRAAQRHTAAATVAPATRRALFAEAGVIAVPDLASLTAAAAVLAVQPPPTGRRVAVLSTAAGMGVVTADACHEAGLELPELTPRTVNGLRRLLPNGAPIANPVDLGAGSVATMAAALGVVAADPNVDSVVVLPVPTALGDVHGLIWPTLPVPLVVVRPDQPHRVAMEPQVPTGSAPAYDDPRDAALALARAADYADWRDRPREPVPPPSGMDLVAAQAEVATQLAARPEGGRLDPADAVRLLAAAGVELPAGGSPAGPDGTADGPRFRVGMAVDPTFGPVVTACLVRADGTAATTPVVALAPIAADRADELGAELLGPNASPVSVRTMGDLLARIGYLAHRVPDVATVDLDGVVEAAGVAVVDATTQVRPHRTVDPYLRRLR